MLPISPRKTTGIIIAVMVLFVCAIPAGAQSFVVRGVVHMDRPSGAPAVMATVLIPGTLFGGITDENGRFELGPVPNGEYSLRVLVSGYKDAVYPISISDSDVELELVSRRADVDLDRPDEQSDLTQSTFSSRTYSEPGTLADLIRSEPSFEIGRIGWVGGQVRKDAPEGPFASQGFTIDGTAHISKHAFPITNRISGTSRLPRRFSIADESSLADAGPGQSLIRSLDAHPTVPDRAFPRIVIDGGAHSNGRLVQGALALDGQQGRLRYEASVSGARAGDYETGSGATTESTLRRVAAEAAVSIRLTPFSDLLAQYAGSFDGHTILPGTPYSQDGADDRNGGITFRLSRPESRVNQLSAGLTFGYEFEDTRTVELDGASLPFAQFASEYIGVAASAGHRLGDRSSGSLSAFYRETAQTSVVGEQVVPSPLAAWSSKDMRVNYNAKGNLSSSAVSATIDFRKRRIDHQGSQADFDLVSAHLEVTRRLRPALAATVHLSSVSDAPSPAMLFGVQFPMQVGQRLAFVNGDGTLPAERFNKVALKLTSVRSSAAFSLMGSLVDLHRYTSIRADADRFVLTESSGTALSVSGRVTLARPPFASASLLGIWAYGVDQNTKERIVGTRSPRLQWSARIQTPGGSIFVRPAVNAVIGVSSADLEWERDTGTAVWIDLVAGMTRGSVEWVLGVRNLNDSTWRYHTSLLAFSTDSPMYEPGRSFFIRHRRRL